MSKSCSDRSTKNQGIPCGAPQGSTLLSLYHTYSFFTRWPSVSSLMTTFFIAAEIWPNLLTRVQNQTQTQVSGTQVSIQSNHFLNHEFCHWKLESKAAQSGKDILIINVHPSIHYLYRLYLTGSQGAGANPNCHWASHGVHPGPVASQSQGWHTKTDNHSHSHWHSHSDARAI